MRFCTQSLIIIFLITLSFTLIGPIAFSQNNYEAQKYFGAVFGDSLAYTAGALNRSNSLSNCLTKKTGYKFGNFGVNGATTHDALNFVDKVIKESPKVTLISLGGNDVLHALYNDQTQNDRILNHKYSRDNTFKHLVSIYRKFKSVGSVVVHLGISPPRVTDDHASMIRDSRLEDIEQVAHNEGVYFMANFMTDLWLNPKLMLDKLHPNNAGAKIQCERIYEYLVNNKIIE